MTETTFEDVISRDPTDEEYFTALGAFVSRFVVAEWDAAYCCDELEDDYVRNIRNPIIRENKRIKKHIKLAEQLPASSEKDELLIAMQEDLQEEVHKTASTVAEKLISLVKKQPASNDKEELLKAAKVFQEIVKDERNSVYHSRPITLDGKPALHKDGKSYTIADLRELTVKTFDCSLVLNKAHHGFLKRVNSSA